MSNSLDLDQARHFVGPDLGPNCLQRLSADDTLGLSRYAISVSRYIAICAKHIAIISQYIVPKCQDAFWVIMKRVLT